MRSSILILFLILLSTSAYSFESSSLRLNEFNVDLKTGYAGNYWMPQGLGPFEVDTYGKSLYYGEISITHPLLTIGEAMDIIQIPRLRVETNFGYTENSDDFYLPISKTLTDNAYLKTVSWFTIFDHISIVFQREKFQVSLKNPGYWSAGVPNSGIVFVKNVENSINVFECGLMGPGINDFEGFWIGVGYQRTSMQWPFVVVDEDFNYYLNNEEENLVMNSAYFSVLAETIKSKIPISTQLKLTVGNFTGFEIKLKSEKKVFKKLRVGLDVTGSWQMVSLSSKDRDKYKDDYIEMYDFAKDTRLKVTVYSAFRLFGID